jgi:CRISPR-associated endonuclease/helicase Cas3
MTSLPDFRTFFHALWGYDPFPWQEMLAARTAAGCWPQALDLPTASGKTACIDVAIHALAGQSERPLAKRTAPRRIWFVVDRRIVVDEAHERARAIADKLADAKEGPLKAIADRLRQIAGTDRPLAVARLRGGVLRDDGWGRLPSQPAVITSTVDQLGSRLLFRGYGHSLLTAPIFAGLAANDSLIVLDEAHCSVPFLQTLRAIEKYRGTAWAESPLETPFAFVVLSATPPRGIPEDAIFPGTEREQALDHPVLRKRLQASKPAGLIEVKAASASGDDPLVAEAVKRAQGCVEAGKRRVGVIVNRVRTAQEIAHRLREQPGDGADIVLLTGRMRAFERDRLVDHWKPYLRATRPDDPSRPIVLVSTQCLEVGADFSFGALVTECASLDALRQRFGRLARMGAEEPAPATIIVRESEVEAEQPDPIYGEAISKTWKWLCDNAAPDGEGKPVIDFGVEALGEKLRDIEDLSDYLAPTVDAPILLPAHLDLLCETSPTPRPEPDVSLYLHGKHGPPEVRVVWRCDLSPDNIRAWIETVALCPPASGEMLSVPLWRLSSWLAQAGAADDWTDIEGVSVDAEETSPSLRPCLLWRGRDRSKVAKSAGDIAPGEVVIVPAAYRIEGLGQSAAGQAVGSDSLDLWEPARVNSGRSAAVRLHRAALAPWLGCPPLKELVATAEAPTWDREEILVAIDAVLGYAPEGEDAPPPPPSWWLDHLRTVRGGRMDDHPAGGIVLFARETADTRRRGEPDLFADDDDLTSASDREVSLDDHSVSVERAANKLARRCLPEDLLAQVRLAAYWHDVGKLDERFQVMLRQGDEVAAASASAPLAKSAFIPASPARRRAIREASGLPENFRHEMLSAQLAKLHAPLPANDEDADLILHLIASHHGHARPFAPLSPDPTPPGVSGRLGSEQLNLVAKERAALTAPHRVDSGLSDRFWRMTRRYGWWGLAYLEAIVRLADWYGSAFVIEQAPGEESEQ